jgi:enterochelin esterase-like enzyme
MEIIQRFEVPGLSGEVIRADFQGQIVDYWCGSNHPTHLIVAHDGQHIFERGVGIVPDSWRLAETATQVFSQLGLEAPLIIAAHNHCSEAEPLGRARHLIPEASLRSGVTITQEKYQFVNASNIWTDRYLDRLTKEITPEISSAFGFTPQPEKTAMLGASLGGLAAIYGMIRFPNFYKKALAFSPHWLLAGEPLAQDLIARLPDPKFHKIWMSRGTDDLDSTYEPTQNFVDSELPKLGWDSDRFASFVFEGDEHNEYSWQRRVDPALRYWLAN